MLCKKLRIGCYGVTWPALLPSRTCLVWYMLHPAGVPPTVPLGATKLGPAVLKERALQCDGMNALLTACPLCLCSCIFPGYAYGTRSALVCEQYEADDRCSTSQREHSPPARDRVLRGQRY